MAAKIPVEFTVIRDKREQKDYFDFPEGERNGVICHGTKWGTLKTADYTLKGHETEIVIERKASTGELSQNMFEERFEQELIRLEEFSHPFMVFQFTLNDVKTFPINSSLPKFVWHKVKMTPEFMLSTLARYQIQYKTKIIFAGDNAEEVVFNLFKAFMKYGTKDGTR